MTASHTGGTGKHGIPGYKRNKWAKDGVRNRAPRLGLAQVQRQRGDTEQKSNEEGKTGNGKSHADITISCTRTTFFPVRLKRNHTLGIYTQRGGQAMRGAAAFRAASRPSFLPTAPRAAGPRGGESLLGGGGSTGSGQGEGRKGNSRTRRVVLTTSEKIPDPEPKQLLSCPQTNALLPVSSSA